MSIDRYYEILQVSPTASVDEVKRAFRKQAMLLHPDRNSALDAHEKFLLLTEAYEFIAKNRQVNVMNRHHDYERWQAEEREQARARAAEHARMRYEDYIHSDYYQSIAAIETAVNHILLFSMFAVMIALPIVASFYYGWIAMVISIIILVITSPASISAFKEAHISLNAFLLAMRYIISRKKTIFFLSCVVNLFLFFRYGFQTLFPTWWLILSFGIISLGSWFLLKINNQWYRKMLSFSILPLLLNIFLATNYIFSSHSYQKQFQIDRPEEDETSSFDESTLITLVDNQLSDYWGVRTFLNYSQLKNKDFVIYTFQDGLWGIPVMTDYQFK